MKIRSISAARWETILTLTVLLSVAAGAGPATRPPGRATTQQAMPSTRPAATPEAALQGYWGAVQAGFPDEAVTAYLDAEGLLDQITGADAKLTGEPRGAAVADLCLIIAGSWQSPGVAEAIRDSELAIKSTKVGADGLTQIDYVITMNRPQRAELPNSIYLRKAKDGWRIVDMNQANGPRMSAALGNGYAAYKKAAPTGTLENFLFEVMLSVRHKAAAATRPAAGGGATTRRIGNPTTRPAGR